MCLYWPCPHRKTLGDRQKPVTVILGWGEGVSEAFDWTLLYVNYDCVTYLKNKAYVAVCVCKASCSGLATQQILGRRSALPPDVPTTCPDPCARDEEALFPALGTGWWQADSAEHWRSPSMLELELRGR